MNQHQELAIRALSDMMGDDTANVCPLGCLPGECKAVRHGCGSECLTTPVPEGMRLVPEKLSGALRESLIDIC